MKFKILINDDADISVITKYFSIFKKFEIYERAETYLLVLIEPPGKEETELIAATHPIAFFKSTSLKMRGLEEALGSVTICTPSQGEVVIISVVTMRQARLALLYAGLLEGVSLAIMAMGGVAGEAARIEWEYAQEVHRDSLLITSLIPVLGLTEAQLDDLFRWAITL